MAEHTGRSPLSLRRLERMCSRTWLTEGMRVSLWLSDSPYRGVVATMATIYATMHATMSATECNQRIFTNIHSLSTLQPSWFTIHLHYPSKRMVHVWSQRFASFALPYVASLCRAVSLRPRRS